MRRAVDVPGFDREQDGAFGLGLVALVEQPLHQRGVVFDDVGAAPQFDALAARRVDQKQIGAVLFEAVQIFEEKQPRSLLGIIQLGSAASLFPEDIVNVFEGLFEHWLVGVLIVRDGPFGCGLE
jgi:hypothetical protein